MHRWAIVLALCACSPDLPVDPMEQFLRSEAAAALGEVQRLTARGEDPSFACTSLFQLETSYGGRGNSEVKTIIRTGMRYCRREAPLAWAKASIARLEAARKADPDVIPTRDCVALERALGMLEGGDAAESPEHRALLARRAELCP